MILVMVGNRAYLDSVERILGAQSQRVKVYKYDTIKSCVENLNARQLNVDRVLIMAKGVVTGNPQAFEELQAFNGFLAKKHPSVRVVSVSGTPKQAKVFASVFSSPNTANIVIKTLDPLAVEDLVLVSIPELTRRMQEHVYKEHQEAEGEKEVLAPPPEQTKAALVPKTLPARNKPKGLFGGFFGRNKKGQANLPTPEGVGVPELEAPKAEPVPEQKGPELPSEVLKLPEERLDYLKTTSYLEEAEKGETKAEVEVQGSGAEQGKEERSGSRWGRRNRKGKGGEAGRTAAPVVPPVAPPVVPAVPAAVDAAVTREPSPTRPVEESAPSVEAWTESGTVEERLRGGLYEEEESAASVRGRILESGPPAPLADVEEVGPTLKADRGQEEEVPDAPVFPSRTAAEEPDETGFGDLFDEQGRIRSSAEWNQWLDKNMMPFVEASEKEKAGNAPELSKESSEEVHETAAAATPEVEVEVNRNEDVSDLAERQTPEDEVEVNRNEDVPDLAARQAPEVAVRPNAAPLEPTMRMGGELHIPKAQVPVKEVKAAVEEFQFASFEPKATLEAPENPVVAETSTRTPGAVEPEGFALGGLKESAPKVEHKQEEVTVARPKQELPGVPALTGLDKPEDTLPVVNLEENAEPAVPSSVSLKPEFRVSVEAKPEDQKGERVVEERKLPEIKVSGVEKPDTQEIPKRGTEVGVAPVEPTTAVRPEFVGTSVTPDTEEKKESRHFEEDSRRIGGLVGRLLGDAKKVSKVHLPQKAELQEEPVHEPGGVGLAPEIKVTEEEKPAAPVSRPGAAVVFTPAQEYVNGKLNTDFLEIEGEEEAAESDQAAVEPSVYMQGGLYVSPAEETRSVQESKTSSVPLTRPKLPGVAVEHPVTPQLPALPSQPTVESEVSRTSSVNMRELQRRMDERKTPVRDRQAERIESDNRDKARGGGHTGPKANRVHSAVRVVVVTGDRKSGVTRTAVNLAAQYSKQGSTLFVDFDRYRNGSLSYLGVGNIMDEPQEVQAGITNLHAPAGFSRVVYPFVEGGFDCLVSMYGTDVDDECLNRVQRVITMQRTYKTVIVDCPLENLYLLSDMIKYAEVLVCAQAEFTSLLSTVIELERASALGEQEDELFGAYLYTQSKYMLMGTTSNLNTEASVLASLTEFQENLLEIADFFALEDSERDWSELPVLSGVSPVAAAAAQ